MRYARVRVAPTEGAGDHPLGARLAEVEDVERERVHRIELLDDGTGLLLAEASGDRDRYERLLADSEFVHDYTVTGTGGNWYAYVHFEPNEQVRGTLAEFRDSELMIEMPIEALPDGAREMTFVGDEAAFADAIPTDPERYDVELLEMGERPPRADDLFSCLTERQREVLDAALERGYYENPRRATHEEVADALDVSPSTVGEHLRKIESRVFSQFARER
ncbi:helix-turn-helix domain-containing protein [Halorussus sp. MSC15.2]|uniref:helix-turn-helix domain-containing protein n=1 Tax=Halorussus sp. MSC15.2 TaxID=2283638 RepID=UPI0013CFC56D|nr:helix-turn-helix domain-containing protein [Halorussus sp. MSC15.2]NEU55388.1 bacterio-opsin activator [Halorussus sp. MSC15.2]